jgi:hypothetical protein
MTWIGLLAVVGVVIALVVVVGARPRGGRPADRTQLMTAGRVVALAIALLLAYVAFGR